MTKVNPYFVEGVRINGERSRTNPSTSLGMVRENGERSRTIKFFTLGCKVNQYETQETREQFIAAGFEEIDNGKKADIYVINTCTVTRRADCDSLSFIRRARRENPGAKILVAGCLTEKDTEQIKDTDNNCLIVKKRDRDDILNSLTDKFSQAPGFKKGISYFKGHTRAFLKIQDGCNNFCSYCKVPKVRSHSRSKPLKEVIKEAKLLARNGFKEVVLCGICLGEYGSDLTAKITLVDVLNALEGIRNILRIRLSSIEAKDVSPALIQKIAGSGKICRHLHIPLQSGDDEILKKMNRKFSHQDYSRLIKKIRDSIPKIAITTDAIVGFPGEGRVNFENTLSLIQEISPLKTHIFPYSPRPGTQAYHFKERVLPLEMKERVLRLKNIAEACAFNYKKQFLNQDMDVLIEGPVYGEGRKGYWQGHTGNYIKVLLESRQNLKNQIVYARLKRLVKDYVEGGRMFLKKRKRFP